MFAFGDPADTAKLYLDEIMTGLGPSTPDLHFEEMEEPDLRIAMAWLHAAAAKGLREGLEAEVQDILVEWYDEVFIALTESSDRFRTKWREGVITPPGGQNTRAKYAKIIKDASEN